jgi:O-methyltransferase
MNTPIDNGYAASLHVMRKSILTELRRVQLSTLRPGVFHEQVIPNASYAPWRQDAVFKKLMDVVRGRTMVDEYRCYELFDLGRQLGNLRGDVLEVGVWRGGTAAILACSQMVGALERLWLADTFCGVAMASDRDTNYVGGEHSDTSRHQVESLMAELKINNYSILEGQFPAQSKSLVEAARFKFCHIDTDTYQSAKDSFDFVWSRMVAGGWVVFDDYGFWGCEGVTEAVNEIKNRGIVVIHNLNGHALIRK